MGPVQIECRVAYMLLDDVSSKREGYVHEHNLGSNRVNAFKAVSNHSVTVPGHDMAVYGNCYS